MPVYEYQDTETGTIVTMERPVAERDQVPSRYRRTGFPSRFALKGVGDVPYHPAAPDGRNVLAGYYAQEQKLGSRFRPGHRPETIKKAWQNHRSPDPK